MTRKKERTWLCQGCSYAPKEGVIAGTVNCEAAGSVVDAVSHTRYRRFESCPHRQHLSAGFLQLLAKRCREERARSNEDLTAERVAVIEAQVKKELKMK